MRTATQRGSFCSVRMLCVGRRGLRVVCLDEMITDDRWHRHHALAYTLAREPPLAPPPPHDPLSPSLPPSLRPPPYLWWPCSPVARSKDAYSGTLRGTRLAPDLVVGDGGGDGRVGLLSAVGGRLLAGFGALLQRGRTQRLLRPPPLTPQPPHRTHTHTPFTQTHRDRISAAAAGSATMTTDLWRARQRKKGPAFFRSTYDSHSADMSWLLQ